MLAAFRGLMEEARSAAANAKFDEAQRQDTGGAATADAEALNDAVYELHGLLAVAENVADGISGQEEAEVHGLIALIKLLKDEGVRCEQPRLQLVDFVRKQEACHG